jgi:hypothetical protein
MFLRDYIYVRPREIRRLDTSRATLGKLPEYAVALERMVS